MYIHPVWAGSRTSAAAAAKKGRRPGMIVLRLQPQANIKQSRKSNNNYNIEVIKASKNCGNTTNMCAAASSTSGVETNTRYREYYNKNENIISEMNRSR